MPNLLKSFAPWIIFFVLLGPSTSALQLASIAALVSHIALNKRALKHYFVLDWGGLICFVLFALIAFLYPLQWLIDHASVALNAAIALIAWLSLLIKRPFTLQYARLQTPQHLQDTSEFVQINYLLTLLWALLLSLMLLPNVIEHFISWQYDTELNIIISIGLIMIGVWLTNALPPHLIRRGIQQHLDIDMEALYQQHHLPPQDLTRFQAQQLVTQCDHTHEVIIVGAGPVGLTTALLLQQHGIQVVIIEKHAGISTHPKARGMSCRTVELFRRLGIEANITKHNLPEAHTWFGWFNTLTGTLYGRVTRDIHYKTISPCEPGTSAQPFIEQELLAAFEQRGGKVLFKHKLTNLAQNEQCAQVWVEDLNTRTTNIHQAQYFVAADGNHSTMRQLLNIPMIGPDNLSNNLSVYCEMDLHKVLDEKHRFGIAYVMEATGPAPMILSIDDHRRWVVIFPGGSNDFEAFKALHTDTVIQQRIHNMIVKVVQWSLSRPIQQRIHNMIGRDDIAIHVISKQFWQLGSQIANHFQAGRTFFAGDSMHQFSPTGGMGMNTGLLDADNLAWKLAYVIQKRAPQTLLETYQTEVRPIILKRMNWSLQNLLNIVTMKQTLAQKTLTEDKVKLLIETQRGHMNQSGLDLGAVYQSRGICPTQSPAPMIDDQHYHNLIYPGARFPHLPLKQGRKQISTLDLVGCDFTLICLSTSRSLAQAIDFNKIPTKIIALGDQAAPKEAQPGNFAMLMNHQQHCAAWVRPDGHIAWCGSLDRQSDLQTLRSLITWLSS